MPLGFCSDRSGLDSLARNADAEDGSALDGDRQEGSRGRGHQHRSFQEKSFLRNDYCSRGSSVPEDLRKIIVCQFLIVKFFFSKKLFFHFVLK